MNKFFFVILLIVSVSVRSQTVKPTTVIRIKSYATSKYSETDPVFLSSVASSITSSNISNWNNKLSSYTETDPIFLSSVASNISSTNINDWNAKQPQITLTTSGSTGAATFSGTTLNIPNYGSSSYTLPIASSTFLGGVKIGTGLMVDTSGVLSATSSTRFGVNGEDNSASSRRQFFTNYFDFKIVPSQTDYSQSFDINPVSTTITHVDQNNLTGEGELFVGQTKITNTIYDIGSAAAGDTRLTVSSQRLDFEGKQGFHINSDLTGINISQTNPSSLFTVNSFNKGVLIPRMTKLDRSNIASPENGLLVFVTDNGGYLSWFFNGSWQKIASTID